MKLAAWLAPLTALAVLVASFVPAAAAGSPPAWSAYRDAGGAIGIRVQFEGSELSGELILADNTDASLPASHLVTITLDNPGDWTNLVAIRARQGTSPDLQPVSGASARAAPGLFLFAMSGSDTDTKANIQLLGGASALELVFVTATGSPYGRVLIPIDTLSSGGIRDVMAR